MRTHSRVMLVGPYWGGGWTESVESSLKGCGLEVEVFYYNRPYFHKVIKQVSSDLGIKYNELHFWIRQLHWIVMGLQIGRLLYDAVIRFQPDLIIVLKGELILPTTIRKLKHLKNRPTIVAWWVDNPVLYGERHRWWVFPYCVPLFDKFYIFDYSYIEVLKKMGAKDVIFLPCAADPAHYHPVDITEEHLRNFASSVCFVASFYKSRGDLLAPFIDIPGIGIWGGGWKQYLQDIGREDMFHIVRAQSLSMEDVNIAYQAAKVVLNSHHTQTKRAGLNTRTFEVLASGGMELTDYVEEMESLLTPGEDVVVYRSPEEGAQLAMHLISDESTRKRIAHSGHERVMSEHTYDHRVRTILNTL